MSSSRPSGGVTPGWTVMTPSSIATTYFTRTMASSGWNCRKMTCGMLFFSGSSPALQLMNSA